MTRGQTTTSRPIKKKPNLTLNTLHTKRVDDEDAPTTPSLQFSDERFDAVINHVDDINTIIEGELYMGNSIAAQDDQVLREKGITLMINCTDSEETQHNTDIKYVALNLRDAHNEDISQQWTKTISMMANEIKQHGRVFVYCAAGISRSVAVIIPFLMKERGYTFRDAFLYVQKRRPIIAPNLKYVAAMVQFEKDLYSVNTLSLYEYSLYYSGVITVEDMRKGNTLALTGQSPTALKVNKLMEECGGDYDALVAELLKLTGH